MNKSKCDFNIELGTTSIANSNNSNYLNVFTRLDKNFMLLKVSFYGSYKFSKSKNIWLIII